MRAYETVFILTPVLSEKEVAERTAKYVEGLEAEGAEILHKEDMGLKKLAYPIDGKTLGFYYLIEFKANAQQISQLETLYKRDECVIRYLLIRLDKHALAYNERRRQQLAAAAQSTAETAEESNTSS